MKLAVPLFSLAAFAAHVVAGPPEYDPGRVLCESSDASPYIHHIDQLIDSLRNSDDGDTCFIDNLGYTDDQCGATIKDYTSKDGGAVFSICSGQIDKKRPAHCAGGPPGKVSCKDCQGWSKDEIARMLEAIRDECKNPHRAGGIYYLRPPPREERRGGQVRLYTIPASK